MFDNTKISDITPIKPAPRVEGCELVLMKKGTDDKGNISVAFTFKDAKGGQIVHREFMPKKFEGGSKPMTEEDYKKSIGMNIGRIAHISRAFLTQAEWDLIKVAGNTESMVQTDIEANWTSYVKMTAIAMQVDAAGVPRKAAGIKVALKVVFSRQKDKYYSALPKVPPFISSDAHPKDFSTNPQYDLYEIPSITPDKEAGAAATSESTAAEFGVGAGAAQPAATAAAEHESGF